MKRIDNLVLAKAPTPSSGPVSLASRLASTSESTGQKKSQRGKRAAGKLGDAPKPTYLNLAANQTLQAGKAVLYKGGRLSRLNRALKKEQDDGGLRNLLSLPPTDFSVIGNAIYFAK